MAKRFHGQNFVTWLLLSSSCMISGFLHVFSSYFFKIVHVDHRFITCAFNFWMPKILHNLGQMPGNRIIGNDIFGAAPGEGKDDNSTPVILVYLVVCFGSWMVSIFWGQKVSRGAWACISPRWRPHQRRWEMVDRARLPSPLCFAQRAQQHEWTWPNSSCLSICFEKDSLEAHKNVTVFGCTFAIAYSFRVFNTYAPFKYLLCVYI